MFDTLNPPVIAFLLTLFAGLATGIGSAIAFFAKRTNAVFLASSLGFSAGVMTYVSFVEILPTAQEAIAAEKSDRLATWIAVGAFFGGVALIAILDKFVPEIANPHEFSKITERKHDGARAHAMSGYTSINASATGAAAAKSGAEGASGSLLTGVQDPRLMRVGLMTAIALAIHNFPEGFATFLSGMQEASLAIPIAIAIAIHNIPEGIAVSLPIYYATGSRKKGFWYSFISGLAEPLGALIGWLVLSQFITDTIFGIVFAAVAGIMVFISFDELLPAAEEYGEHHHAIYGLIAGMAVMALSLLLFA